MRYAVVIEKAEANYSAYVPDLPGCVATGLSVDAVEAEIREAIRFHIEGLRADGDPVPPPTSIAEYMRRERRRLIASEGLRPILTLSRQAQEQRRRLAKIMRRTRAKSVAGCDAT